MSEWNRNEKMGFVNTGISRSNTLCHEHDFIDLCGYRFKFIQELEPERDLLGKIKLFDPKCRYYKKGSTPLNRYGNGPFCKFSLSSKGFLGICGVYALFDSKSLLYVGKTQNLEQRFNQGYGIIAPKNCFIAGQSTNCKINAAVLSKYLKGDHIYLFFHETKFFDAVEGELIEALMPPYNTAGKSHTQKEMSMTKKEYTEGAAIKMTKMDIIVQFLTSKGSHVFCDDCLSNLCHVYPRQQVNQICNRTDGTVFCSDRAACSYCGKYKKVRKLIK